MDGRSVTMSDKALSDEALSDEAPNCQRTVRGGRPVGIACRKAIETKQTPDPNGKPLLLDESGIGCAFRFLDVCAACHDVGGTCFGD
ncbi:hypothetical protein BCR44DRAFT_1444145 [Catenaria anguillulae PL171]|uniref:Uncharacterized protein n=1 Tax=Catenaria anguillulae PL171 TaxID=765915 RepID=A0A1Y2H7W4_9FUNG|nr:hypothetical protein BCR44DRAFT_1444145 [Catenaria anguillulae PL171]